MLRAQSMRSVISIAILIVLSLIGGPANSEESAPKQSPWDPIRFMVGEWRGTAEGESGTGSVQRTYAFVLKDRFLQEKNVTAYAPTEKKPGGEIHEHLGYFSYDRGQKALVLRQFHQEGFVNRYVMQAGSSAPTLVFNSTEFENFDNSLKARETYTIISPDEFVEVFELAPPGKPFEVYSKTHLKRVK